MSERAGWFDAPPRTLEELEEQYIDWCHYRAAHVTDDTPRDNRARVWSDDDAVNLLREVAAHLGWEV